jgi:hypothetical protein
MDSIMLAAGLFLLDGVFINRPEPAGELNQLLNRRPSDACHIH